MRPILSCAVTIFITILLTSVAHAHHNPKHGNLASLERMLPGAATVPGVASLDVPALRSGVDMTIATDSTATAITGLRLRTVELYPLDEVRLSWLGVATEARAFDRTRTRRYEVGSYSVAKNLESRWGLLLRLESAGVFSLVQSTSPDGKPENADRPCGSQRHPRCRPHGGGTRARRGSHRAFHRQLVARSSRSLAHVESFWRICSAP